MTETKLSGREFDPKRTGQKILKFMQSSFDASFDKVVKVQDLNERMLNEMMTKGKSAEADSQRAVKDLLAKVKKESADYRKSMEDGFKKIKETLEGK
jgi:polyhydroxyalkanoate synthesis regulator phasin